MARRVLFVAAACLAILFAAPAAYSASSKKSIWGPTEVGGKSQFPTYHRLGAGIYQTSMSWADVAPTKPASPANPADPAYNWPADIDYAIREGRKYGIRVSILITGAPGWANGDRDSRYAPSSSKAFATFASAAAHRFPRVHHWMIWGEPSKASRFQPLTPATGRKLTKAQKRGPRIYARLLDASYGALKQASKRNIVIGGDTWTGGDITPLNFIRAMRLPNGRRPRMDLYGHNPFTARLPDLKSDPLQFGFADFSDLDTLAGWLDRYGYRTPRGRKLRLFLSELVIPTDHKNVEFNFWVDRSTQARWLKAALKITRKSRRIYTLGYLGLYDDPARADGLEVNRGLIDRNGKKKRAFFAYRDG